MPNAQIWEGTSVSHPRVAIRLATQSLTITRSRSMDSPRVNCGDTAASHAPSSVISSWYSTRVPVAASNPGFVAESMYNGWFPTTTGVGLAGREREREHATTVAESALAPAPARNTRRLTSTGMMTSVPDDLQAKAKRHLWLHFARM